MQRWRCFGVDGAVLGQTQQFWGRRSPGTTAQPLSAPSHGGSQGTVTLHLPREMPLLTQGTSTEQEGTEITEVSPGGERLGSHLDAQARTRVLGLPLICCRTLASDCTLGLCLHDPWAAGSTHNPGVIWGPGFSASEELQVTAAPKSQLCDPLWAATQPRLSAELSTAAGTAQDHRARLESPGQHGQAGLIPLS